MNSFKFDNKFQIWFNCFLKNAAFQLCGFSCIFEIKLQLDKNTQTYILSCRMPTNCAKCDNPISRNKPGTKCYQCVSEVHYSCVGFSSDLVKLSEAGGFKWVCTACSEYHKKPNIESKLDQIMLDLARMNKQQSEFINSLNFYGDKMQDIESQLKSVMSLGKEVSDLNSELSLLRKENVSMKKELNDIQQQLKQRDLEIVGVPEAKNENVGTIIRDISSKLGIPSLDTCVENYYRVHSSSKDKPRPIIINFKTKLYRSEFMKAYKRHKSLNTADIGVKGPISNIYVNESLTAHNRKLFYVVRQFAKTNAFKYCWTQDCKILLRKDEGSRIVHVTSENQLQNLSN